MPPLQARGSLCCRQYKLPASLMLAASALLAWNFFEQTEFGPGVAPGVTGEAPTIIVDPYTDTQGVTTVVDPGPTAGVELHNAPSFRPDQWLRYGVEHYDGYGIARRSALREAVRAELTSNAALSLWFRTSSGGAIMSADDICIWVVNGKGFLLVRGDDNRRHRLTFGTSLSDMSWHSVVIATSSTDGATVVYVDGFESARVESKAVLAKREYWVGGAPDGGGGCASAGRMSGKSRHRCGTYFSGQIADVGFWSSRAIGEQEAARVLDPFEEDLHPRGIRKFSGFAAVRCLDGNEWTREHTNNGVPLHLDLQDRFPPACKKNVPVLFLFLIGHLRAFPGLDPLGALMASANQSTMSTIAVVSTPERSQVLPSGAGREHDKMRVDDAARAELLEELTAPSTAVLASWWPRALRRLRKQSPCFTLSAEVLSERSRDRTYLDLMSQVGDALPESEAPKSYIFRLFASKLQLLRAAHRRARESFKAATGNENPPPESLVIVTRPDVHVSGVPEGLLADMASELRRDPRQVFTDYEPQWVSNDQFFATSYQVAGELASFDYACFAKKSFLSRLSIFGTGFTRNLTKPHLKWGRDWYYAETSLLVMLEALVGTKHIRVMEGNWKGFEIRRDCPLYGDVGWGASRSGKTDGQGAPRLGYPLDWPHVDRARAACGGSSPSCPDPFKKGRFPFIAKKIMRMFIQHRNKTVSEWERERPELLQCVRGANQR